MVIVGAGLAGLLAANYFRKNEPIVLEAQQSLPNNHNSLLRFRSDICSNVTSIPFKKVCVTKNINCGGKIYTHPTIKFSNQYSQKVTGKYLSRSINNLDSVDRFISPPDFISRMATGCDIKFGQQFDFHLLKNSGRPIISTIPMPVLMALDKYEHEEMFEYRTTHSITADLCDDSDLYQTIYYTDSNRSLYRMSISGSKLIAEYIDVHKNNYTLDDRINNIIDYLFCDFGINCGIDNVNSHTQKYGKITPIDDRVRKDFMLHLSKKYNIYSLGRFATWRQILLDDVCKDLRVIESLINSGGYDR